MRSNVSASRAGSRPAWFERKWGNPSIAAGRSTAGGRSGKPKRDTTPSTSTGNGGRPLQLLIEVDVRLTSRKVLKKHPLWTDDRGEPGLGDRVKSATGLDRPAADVR
jgi:hypothetical protein